MTTASQTRIRCAGYPRASCQNDAGHEARPGGPPASTRWCLECDLRRIERITAQIARLESGGSAPEGSR